jgi:hypothetical protein
MKKISDQQYNNRNTAMLSVLALEHGGVTPDRGDFFARF